MILDWCPTLMQKQFPIPDTIFHSLLKHSPFFVTC